MTPIGYPLPVTTQTVAPTVTTTTSKGTSSSGSTAKKSSNGSSSNDKDKRKRSPSPRSSRKRSSSRDRHRHSSPRRRSKSPRRRSRSPPKKKRSRSRDRDRTRRRSRSRDRSRDRSRRSSSRSRTSRSSKDSGDKKILSKGDLSWMDSAAAFLEKLGDVSAAKSIREHKQSSGVPPVVTQPAVAPPVVVSAAPTTRQIPSLALVTPQTVLPPARVQPQQMIYRAPPPLTTLPPVRIGFPPPQQQQQAKPLVPQQQPVCITLDDDRPQQQPPVRDEKAEMRKLLGVLITMQQEAERSGGLDPATVDRLYQEVGLKKTEGLNSDQLLAQLLTQLAGSVPTEKKTVDLSAFGISAASTSAPMSQPPPSFYPQQQQYNPPSLAPVPQNDQYQKLLAQLNETKRPTPAPIVPQNPYSSMPRTEDFFRDSNVSYVYPDGGAPTEEPQPVQAKAPEPDPKKEKAALRKKKLLEQAELLRKQAEASDGDDDDWDNLESEMTQMLDSAPVATSSATATPTERSSPSLNQARMGVPLKWAQPVPQPVKPPALTPFIPTPQQQEVVPIAPGQKMPLARTMLPNGKLPPGVQQQAPSQETPAAPAAATVEPPVSQAAPSLQPVQQPQPGYSGYGQPTAYMQQPMYGGYQQQQQYGQMYAQPQQYPYMQQGYGMAQQYMQPAAPGTGQAYPQQTAQQQQQQQYYAQYGQQPQQQYKY